MKNIKLLMLCVASFASTAACWAQTPVATPASATQVAPQTVAVTPSAKTTSAEMPVRALMEAMSREDAAAIRAQFASDAGQAYREETLKTPDKFRRWLESDIIARQGKVADPVYTVDGEQVVVRGTYTSQGYRNAANFLFVVKNDKIVSWRMRY